MEQLHVQQRAASQHCLPGVPSLPHLLLLIAVRELTPPGDIASAAQKPLPFEFKNVEMQYDSYRGLQVRCRCAHGISMQQQQQGLLWAGSSSAGSQRASSSAVPQRKLACEHRQHCSGLRVWLVRHAAAAANTPSRVSRRSFAQCGLP